MLKGYESIPHLVQDLLDIASEGCYCGIGTCARCSACSRGFHECECSDGMKNWPAESWCRACLAKLAYRALYGEEGALHLVK